MIAVSPHYQQTAIYPRETPRSDTIAMQIEFEYFKTDVG
jgi:hypothetical protein